MESSCQRVSASRVLFGFVLRHLFLLWSHVEAVAMGLFLVSQQLSFFKHSPPPPRLLLMSQPSRLFLCSIEYGRCPSVNKNNVPEVCCGYSAPFRWPFNPATPQQAEKGNHKKEYSLHLRFNSQLCHAATVRPLSADPELWPQIPNKLGDAKERFYTWLVPSASSFVPYALYHTTSHYPSAILTPPPQFT